MQCNDVASGRDAPSTAQNHHGKRRSNRLGVVGLGAVGSALAYVLEWFYQDVVKFDIVGDYRWEPLLSTEAVFVCVPTPSGSDGHLDCTEVTKVLAKLASDGYRGLVVIRSTLRIGFMSRAHAQFPSLRLVYSPEFLRERSRFQWSANPDRLVVSGDPNDMNAVIGLFDWMEDATVLRITDVEAELGKLAHNAYIATKVSFTNTVSAIANEHGADPSAVMSVVWTDRRVRNKSHLDPTGGPFGGKCVPKDTHELALSSGGSELLEAVENVNVALTAGRPLVKRAD